MRRARRQSPDGGAVQPRDADFAFHRAAVSSTFAFVRVGVELVQHPAVRVAVQAGQQVARQPLFEEKHAPRARHEIPALPRRAVAAGEAGMHHADRRGDHLRALMRRGARSSRRRGLEVRARGALARRGRRGRTRRRRARFLGALGRGRRALSPPAEARAEERADAERDGRREGDRAGHRGVARHRGATRCERRRAETAVGFRILNRSEEAPRRTLCSRSAWRPSRRAGCAPGASP